MVRFKDEVRSPSKAHLLTKIQVGKKGKYTLNAALLLALTKTKAQFVLCPYWRRAKTSRRSQGHRFVSCHDVVAEQASVRKWDKGIKGPRRPDVCLGDRHPRHGPFTIPFLTTARISAILLINIDLLLCAYWCGERRRVDDHFDSAYVTLPGAVGDASREAAASGDTAIGAQIWQMIH